MSGISVEKINQTNNISFFWVCFVKLQKIDKLLNLTDNWYLGLTIKHKEEFNAFWSCLEPKPKSFLSLDEHCFNNLVIVFCCLPTFFSLVSSFCIWKGWHFHVLTFLSSAQRWLFCRYEQIQFFWSFTDSLFCAFFCLFFVSFEWRWCYCELRKKNIISSQKYWDFSFFPSEKRVEPFFSINVNENQ